MDDREALAAKSDPERLNNFIADSRRFIAGCAFRTTHRFVSESDDEWSVAMLAFSEAVSGYDETKGPFRPFAALVIKRRLFDYMTSESRHAGEIAVEPQSMDGEADENGDASPLALELRRRSAELSRSAQEDSQSAAKDEIEAVQDILRGYGFSFFDLADCSPRADKTKKSCAQAVRALIIPGGLLEKMRQTRNLPMKELCAASGVPRKILERHRKYIIAAAEIISGDYPIISGYLGYIRKALET